MSQTLKEKLEEILFEIGYGSGNYPTEAIVDGMNADYAEVAAKAIIKLIEEEVIGKDMPVGDEIADGRSYTGERLHNAIKAEQRMIIKGER